MQFSRRVHVFTWVFFGALTGQSPICHAQDPCLSFSEEVRATWNRAMTGSSELYVPIHTWHNRADYSAQKISQFNETPWGIGYGRGFRDDRQNWHGFYAMAFQDSHRDIQPVVGYGRTWDFIDHSTGWDLGLGYTALVTARKDVYTYHLPFPGVLPLVSLGKNKVTFFATYVPWIDKHGGIAFFFGKITLN
ncbi:MAG: lipid IV(A) palmitoyltransferase PagP [Sulfuricaulis sp.]